LLAESFSRPVFGRRCLRFETLEERVNPAKVVSVMTSGPAITGGAGDLRTGQPVVFTVNFDSAVSVGANGLPTLTLSDGATAAYAGGSGSTALKFAYTVAAGQNSADLTVSAFKLNGSTLQDSGGSAATLTGAVTNPAGTLQIDTTPPGVFNLQLGNTTLQPDGTAVLTYTVSFSENVTGVNASDFSVVTTGAATGVIDSVTPQFGNYILKIDVAGFRNGGSVQPELNSGFIKDSAGNLMNGFGFSPQGDAQQILASSTDSVVVADVNGDGFPDLVAPSEISNSVTVLLGSQTGSFTPAPGSPFAVAAPTFAVVQDVNADGNPDIVVSEGSSDSVSVLLGTGTGSFGTANTFPAGPSGGEAYGIQVVDVSGDGIPDLVVANGTANTVSVLLGTGTGTFSQAPNSPMAVGADPQSVAIGDVNNDGKADLAVADTGSNDITLLLGKGGGTFSPASGSPLAVGQSPRSVTLAVLANGKLDLVAADSGDDNVSVLYGDGTGSFPAAQRNTIPVGNEPRAAVFTDMHDFGSPPDIVTANAGSDNVSVLFGNGNAYSATFAVNDSPTDLVVADLNGDGRPDIVTSGPGGVDVLLGGPADVGGGTGYSPPFIANSSSSGVPGTELDITGANFTTDSGVSIGTLGATVLNVSTDGTQMAVRIPAGVGTNQTLVVGNGTQSSNPSSFNYAPPILSSISPASGPSTGGTVITLTGSIFDQTASKNSVLIGGVAATNVHFAMNGTQVDTTRLIATTPAGTGTPNVTVTAGGQISNALVFGYDLPKINQMTPTSGPATGGTQLTIDGINFGASPQVFIGGVSVTVTNVANVVIGGVSEQEITVITPAGGGSNLPVVVANGTKQSTDPITFSYVPVLATSGSAQVASGVSAVAVVTAIDGSAPLAYSVGGEDGSDFRIDPTTHLVSFIAPPSFAHPVDSNGDNVYNVVVQATDGVQTVKQALVVTVTAVTPGGQPAYVNSAWAALPTGTVIANADPNAAGTPSATIGSTAFPSLQGGIDATTGIVDVLPGTYPDDATFSRILALQVTQGTVTIAGYLVGSDELVKSGSGTLVLTGHDTDAGAQVSAGSLLESGTLHASAATSVLAGATLGGSGTFAGAMTSSGVIAPGIAAGAVGTLTTSDLTLGTASSGAGILSLDLTSATSYDRVALSSLNLTFATLSINAGSALATGDQFTIVAVAGTSGGVTGTFNNLPEGGTFPIGSRVFRINYAAGDGNDVVLTDVTPVSIAGDPAPNLGVAYVNSTLAPQQRSMVESVAYSFSAAIGLSASNFTISGLAGSGTTVVPTLNVSADPTNTVWTVTFSGAGVSPTTHSIGDGEYELALTGVSGLADSTYDFYRLLGDMNGDGVVNISDFSTLVGTFLRAKTDPAYLGADDLDGDGTIGIADVSALVGNYLHTVPTPPRN
jgi:hypothetical protein